MRAEVGRSAERSFAHCTNVRLKVRRRGAPRIVFSEEAAHGSVRGHHVLMLTVGELEHLGEQIESLSAPCETGLGEPSQRPAGTGPVMMLAAGFPHRPAVES